MVNQSIQYNRDFVKNFSQEILLKYENENRNCQKFPISLVQKMHELGILNLLIPKKNGGAELPVQELIHTVKSLAYGSPSFAATFIGNMLGHSAVVMYAGEELKASLCQKMNQSFTLWSFGMTESSVGSDLLSTKTMAVRTKDGFILNGEKNFITNGTYSTDMVVFARLFSATNKDEGISCFYVPGNISGLTRGSIMDKIGWQKANTGTIQFKDVQLDKNYLIGEAGNGLRILTHCLNRSKTLLGAVGVGISERAMDLVIERIFGVTRFSKKLSDQPAIRHLLARLYTKVNAAWLLTQQAASTWDIGKSAIKESSMAKLFSGNTAVEVCSQAMELFGARGYFNDYEVSRLLFDAKAIEIVEGPSLVQELLIAKEILKSKEVNDDHKLNLFELQDSDLREAA
jgi:alkylation response protein AidB-like acyl-CoA dehydrogenase